MSRPRVYGHYIPAEVSFESCVGDWEPKTDGMLSPIEDAEFEKKAFRGVCGLERDVLSLLFEGFDFKQIAIILKKKNSQIYKIKLSLMKRFSYLNHNRSVSLKVRNKSELIHNLIYMFCICHPDMNTDEILEIWEVHTTLREYKKPNPQIIDTAIEEFKKDFNVCP